VEGGCANSGPCSTSCCVVAMKVVGGPSSLLCQQPAVQHKTRSKEKLRKDLTVKPIRLLQEVPSLKKTIKFKIRPENVQALQTQVAGHGLDSKQGRDWGMLLHEEGFVLKPVQAPPKGHREVEFYQHISTSVNQIDARLYSLMPKFYGTERVKGQSLCHEQYIILENLTQGMVEPCVMDIKMGARTYGPDASEAKIKQEDSTYAGTKKPLGFSVLGIISRSDESGSLQRWTKSFGKNLATDCVGQILDNFLVDFKVCDRTSFRAKQAKQVAASFLKQLNVFLELFVEQKRYNLFASSLLFIYDGQCLQDRSNEAQQQVDSRVRLKLIDFAHVYPALDHQPDTNFLFGLKNLIEIFQVYLNAGQETAEEPATIKPVFSTSTT